MKEIIKKTEKEQKQERTCAIVKVKSTGYYYWCCDKCMVAFFDDDLILKCNDGNYCIKERRNLWGIMKKCNNRIYGGDEDTFNKYYKFK
jgi:hypothetical protein